MSEIKVSEIIEGLLVSEELEEGKASWLEVQRVSEEYYGVKPEIISKTDKIGNVHLETVWIWNDKRIMFNLVKSLTGRQTSMLGVFHDGKDQSVAHCKIHADGYLLSNWNRYEFIKCRSSLYFSLANLNGMPLFSFNPIERRVQSEEFNKNFVKYMTGFDCLLDFDAKLIKDIEIGRKVAYNETRLVKALFDEIGLPYRLKASSFNGFHLLIPHPYLAELGLSTPSAQLDFNIRLIHKLKKVYLLDTLDMAGIGVQKMCKADYSLAWGGGKPSVALPLRDEEFEGFKLEMLDPVNVKKLPNLGYRGLLQRENFNKEKCLRWMQEEILNPSYCPTCDSNECMGGKNGI